MTNSTSGSARRGPTLAAVLLVVAAAALWAASRMTWVRVSSADGIGLDIVTDLDGGTWSAATTPLALALLAAVAAVFAVRGRALRVVAVVVFLVAVLAAIPAAGLVATGADEGAAGRIAELPARAAVTGVEVFVLPALLVLAGSVVAVAAAVALWRTPRLQSGLSSKYDSPAVRKEAASRWSEGDEPPTERVLWDALDAGEDPTVDGEDGPGGALPPDSDDSGTRRRPS